MKTYEELLQEAYDNVVGDRAILKEALAELKSKAEENPNLLPDVIRSSGFVVDSLTRSNAQLVELVKVEAKRGGKGGEGFTEDETEDMFDDIRESDGGEAAGN